MAARRIFARVRQDISLYLRAVVPFPMAERVLIRCAFQLGMHQNLIGACFGNKLTTRSTGGFDIAPIRGLLLATPEGVVSQPLLFAAPKGAL